MARALIVGCGCRGRALGRALAAEGIAVRGSSRSAAAGAAMEEAGVEPVVADPDRLATLLPHLAGVSVVCWLLADAGADGLHGTRLETLLAHLVDTPVRGFVYEGSGSAPDELLAGGARLVEEAGERWQMPVAVVRERPADHERWLAAASGSVREVLA